MEIGFPKNLEIQFPKKETCVMWKQNIHNCWNCVRLTTITLANMELEELENRVNALSIRREKLEQKVGSRPILSCVSSSFRVR